MARQSKESGRPCQPKNGAGVMGSVTLSTPHYEECTMKTALILTGSPLALLAPTRYSHKTVVTASMNACS